MNRSPQDDITVGTILASPSFSPAPSPSSTSFLDAGRFSLGPKLGEGAYGLVRHGTHHPTLQTVAIKILNKSEIRAKGAEERVRREIKGLMLCSGHPHIIGLYRSYETPSSVNLAFEFAGGGDLFDYMKRRETNRLEKEESRRFFRQLASGIAHMHSHLVVHRDLKVENLILDETCKNIQIADFGFCRMLSSLDERLVTSCGSLEFCAPELLDAPEMSYFGPPADMWSCGVILYSMLTGGFPFHGKTTEETASLIKGGDFEIPWRLGTSESDMIQLLLTSDPEQRLCSKEILKHAYCQKGLPEYLLQSSSSLQQERKEIHQEVVSHVVRLCETQGWKGGQMEVTSELVERAVALSYGEMSQIMEDNPNPADDRTEIETLLDVRCTYEILLEEKMKGNRSSHDKMPRRASLTKRLSSKLLGKADDDATEIEKLDLSPHDRRASLTKRLSRKLVVKADDDGTEIEKFGGLSAHDKRPSLTKRLSRRLVVKANDDETEIEKFGDAQCTDEILEEKMKGNSGPHDRRASLTKRLSRKFVGKNHDDGTEIEESRDAQGTDKEKMKGNMTSPDKMTRRASLTKRFSSKLLGKTNLDL